MITVKTVERDGQGRVARIVEQARVDAGEVDRLMQRLSQGHARVEAARAVAVEARKQSDRADERATRALERKRDEPEAAVAALREANASLTVALSASREVLAAQREVDRSVEALAAAGWEPAVNALAERSAPAPAEVG